MINVMTGLAARISTQEQLKEVSTLLLSFLVLGTIRVATMFLSFYGTGTVCPIELG
jgi:hypothetical protein